MRIFDYFKIKGEKWDSEILFLIVTIYKEVGKTKTVQNYISTTYPNGHVVTLVTPLNPTDTPIALETIYNEYNRVIGNMEVEPLIVIQTFITNFIIIWLGNKV